MERILNSKVVNSENTAPKYYLFKDHKEGEIWRPVVSGCSSNTLGLSNVLSDIIESLCSSVVDPYEVISSEDLLSRIAKFNEWAKVQDNDWRDDWMLLGTDVKALFPSLSKERTSKAVRNQARKIPIKWNNIDKRWLTLYIHLNRGLSTDISKIKHLLPYKRKNKRGVEPGMSGVECMQRHLLDEYDINGKKFRSTWIWPKDDITDTELHELMAVFLEIAVKFFFDNFVYKFGGQDILQCFGGPIGARVTMCIARLTMQDWWDHFVE